ncbi:N-acetylmuramoyl-L-alanine amidase-like domain-containing protein [Poritiphilus flavus]|uniref:DUF1460 domain-containing protein n=1 Tax=Poritiphilus flavus TaxID=2697053 RepID=A0A6L9E7Z2_9FLAO|nr:N-acetylmuramoyl-L-alanine amidase-like domain-containing protein [Poritiphilus flavus]NAS10856.1 DUF1460 domain-containing protein [Poritiphilus flavus]
MKIKLAILFICCTVSACLAQDIICSAKDKEAFHKKIGELESVEIKKAGENMVAIGKTFLGTPYVAKTLEIGEVESLVVNLHGLDCTTYVENVLAFSLIMRTKNPDFDSFVATLEKIRYRDGELDGYGSRLHYFTEWIANNEQKGLMKDVTAELGGQPLQKEINFMSTHRDLYPFLKSDSNFDKIVGAEKGLNSRSICVLSQDQIATQESLIKSGDIIALATSIAGLDVTHTGIATREADGRIHLLHASSSGQVEVSELPLVDYLKKISKNTGIIVARPL